MLSGRQTECSISWRPDGKAQPNVTVTWVTERTYVWRSLKIKTCCLSNDLKRLITQSTSRQVVLTNVSRGHFRGNRMCRKSKHAEFLSSRNVSQYNQRPYRRTWLFSFEWPWGNRDYIFLKLSQLNRIWKKNPRIIEAIGAISSCINSNVLQRTVGAVEKGTYILWCSQSFQHFNICGKTTLGRNQEPNQAAAKAFSGWYDYCLWQMCGHSLLLSNIEDTEL